MAYVMRVKEQYIDMCLKELEVHLCKNVPESFTELGLFAELYLIADVMRFMR